MKIAIIYDWINKFGGAERILLALHEIWPDAPLYTAVYNEEKTNWAKIFRINPSIINRITLLRNKNELLPLITPYIFESFNLNNFDVVFSVTSADAKSIIVKPSVLHICYCLTPTRYIWSGYNNYLNEPGVGKLNFFAKFFMKLFSSNLRSWDYIASSRPDYYIAISGTVRSRISTYYSKESIVVYPPVDIDKFVPTSERLSEFYLIVSRLVPYKRLDYVISAFNILGSKLKIIGSGIDKKRLTKIAQKNIEFIDNDLTDKKLCWYYQNCRALIFPGEEDFGLTAAEAQACGKPVIGYKKGGISEIVINGKTGELYENADTETLLSVLKNFKPEKYSASICRENSKRFAKSVFQSKIRKLVEEYWNNWRKKI